MFGSYFTLCSAVIENKKKINYNKYTYLAGYENYNGEVAYVLNSKPVYKKDYKGNEFDFLMNTDVKTDEYMWTEVPCIFVTEKKGYEYVDDGVHIEEAHINGNYLIIKPNSYVIISTVVGVKLITSLCNTRVIDDVKTFTGFVNLSKFLTLRLKNKIYILTAEYFSPAKLVGEKYYIFDPEVGMNNNGKKIIHKSTALLIDKYRDKYICRGSEVTGLKQLNGNYYMAGDKLYMIKNVHNENYLNNVNVPINNLDIKGKPLFLFKPNEIVKKDAGEFIGGNIYIRDDVWQASSVVYFTKYVCIPYKNIEKTAVCEIQYDGDLDSIKANFKMGKLEISNVKKTNYIEHGDFEIFNSQKITLESTQIRFIYTLDKNKSIIKYKEKKYIFTTLSGLNYF